jgi:subtilisin family serine protease
VNPRTDSRMDSTMSTVRIERAFRAGRRTRRIRRALLSSATVVALAVVPSTVTPGGVASAAADHSAATAAPRAAHHGDGTYRITLLTGDVAVLTVTPDGRQAAWVADPVDDRRPAQIYRLDGDVYVVPAEAAPFVASGALDDNLFNVTLLVHEGFDDATTDSLPLLVEASDQARASAMPAAPDGTDGVRELDSVNTVSVTADKADIRSAWTSLRGASGAPLTSTDARLAGDRTVWLNGRVEATLDESVAQIGAPEAWDLGYDGAGTTVAVLDTGYDPTHPDLADRVVKAKNFTEDADPDGEVAVDNNGHGTHVASTVGGSGAASDGRHKGVAPAADLIVGKVLDSTGAGSTDQIIAGMEWAVKQGADVVSMSLGTDWASDGTDPLSEAVNRLTKSSGTLFVVAAGNTGPGEQTVGSPGAADLALTVGAVDKDDKPAVFSSRGPRLGDGAIKPEITAPGVDIVAARAAGTSLGDLLDEYYTSLSGTSMATPHVAGAAAILAQEYPNWGAAALKARLISTSKMLQHQPVTFQGGGRVDVAAAVRRPVSVNVGTVFLGRLKGHSDPVVRRLTYHNDTTRPLTLRLSADVTGTGADDSQRPKLLFGQSVVSVPAHGSTTVPVTLLPRSTEPGRYAGQIVARPTGSLGPVHTTMSFSVTGPMRTLTVRAVDRAGTPASGPVDLWNADTGELVRGFMFKGKTSFEVPEGHYALVASIEDAASALEAPTEHTIAGRPELRIRHDMTLRFDARDARPLTATTPREADATEFDVFWNRTVGGHSVSFMTTQGWYGERLFSLQSPAVRTGSFTMATEWRLVQPLLTARLMGPDGFRLRSPQLSSVAGGGWCRDCPPNVIEGQETLGLVDAGDGTAEDFADVDVVGAVALVRHSADLHAQAEAAKQADAAMLLVYNDSDVPWHEEVLNAPLPIYIIDRDTGMDLLDALDRHPHVQLHMDGIVDSTYLYDLVFPERRRIPAGGSYRARPHQLATVTSDYRQNSDRLSRFESWVPYVAGIGGTQGLGQARNGPVVRTEYLTASDAVEWQQFGQPYEFATYYWTISAPTHYRAGRDYQQVWWGPLVHPAVPPASSGSSSAALLATNYQPVTRYRDAIRINMPHYFYGGALAGTIYEQTGDQSEVTLERDGEVVGTSTWPNVQWTVPAEEATYDLTLDVDNSDDNWSDTSVSTHTTWRFSSARADEVGEVLPLLQVGYGLDTDAYNAVPSGQSYPLVLRPGYQPQADGPGSFDAEVEVSFDDGTSWQAAPVTTIDRDLRAQVPAATGPGFASVRVVVTDAEGNEITQRIDRAWKIAAP